MRVIKRYANRKLYDTTAKQYITLDTIAELIRSDEEVRVVDNDTDADITSVVLSQLLLERERTGRFLPTTVLSHLIRAGGDALASVARPLVPSRVREFIEQDVERSFHSWLELGDMTEEEALRLLENLIDQRRQTKRQALRRGRDNLTELDSADEVATLHATIARLRRDLAIAEARLAALNTPDE